MDKKFTLLVDNNLQQEFKIVTKSMGLSASSAIRLFMKQTVIRNELPFQPIIPKKQKQNK